MRACAAGIVLLAAFASPAGAQSPSSPPALVARYYDSILQRPPQPVEAARWLEAIAHAPLIGADARDLLRVLASTSFASDEYRAFGRDDAAFVADLYDAFLQRGADDAGLGYWKRQLALGLPREVAVSAFAFSEEFQALLQPLPLAHAPRAEYAVAGDLYRGLLARAPDDAGLQYYARRFQHAQCPTSDDPRATVAALGREFAEVFASSAEYAARQRTNAQYVADLYDALLRRSGDPAGVAFWVEGLDSGRFTRDAVRQQLAAAPEFAARLATVYEAGCLPPAPVDR